jgi:hypothetical protein
VPPNYAAYKATNALLGLKVAGRYPSPLEIKS